MIAQSTLLSDTITEPTPFAALEQLDGRTARVVRVGNSFWNPEATRGVRSVWVALGRRKSGKGRG